MKKVYVSALALCLIAGAAQAQTMTDKKFKWGCKIGMNFSNLRMENEGSDWKTGLATGLFFNVRLANKFSLQPELLYSSMGGGQMQFGNESKLRLNYFSIPLLVKYKVLNKLAVVAGPQIDFLINAATKQGESFTKVDANYKDNSTNLTAGFEYWPAKCFGLSTRYIYGLTDITVDGATETKNQGVQLTAAIKF